MFSSFSGLCVKISLQKAANKVIYRCPTCTVGWWSIYCDWLYNLLYLAVWQPPRHFKNKLLPSTESQFLILSVLSGFCWLTAPSDNFFSLSPSGIETSLPKRAFSHSFSVLSSFFVSVGCMGMPRQVKLGLNLDVGHTSTLFGKANFIHAQTGQRK